MTKQRQAFDPNRIYQSAGIRHLHYRNFRVGKNASWKSSVALAILAPLMSGELLLASLVALFIKPTAGLRSLFRWAVGLAILLTYGLFGQVYLRDPKANAAS